MPRLATAALLGGVGRWAMSRRVDRSQIPLNPPFSKGEIRGALFDVVCEVEVLTRISHQIKRQLNYPQQCKLRLCDESTTKQSMEFLTRCFLHVIAGRR